LTDRWELQLDEALLEQQQRAYAVEGVDENEPTDQQQKKRKNGDGEQVGYRGCELGDHG